MGKGLQPLPKVQCVQGGDGGDAEEQYHGNASTHQHLPQLVQPVEQHDNGIAFIGHEQQQAEPKQRGQEKSLNGAAVSLGIELLEQGHAEPAGVEPLPHKGEQGVDDLIHHPHEQRCDSGGAEPGEEQRFAADAVLQGEPEILREGVEAYNKDKNSGR